MWELCGNLNGLDLMMWCRLMPSPHSTGPFSRLGGRAQTDERQRVRTAGLPLPRSSASSLHEYFLGIYGFQGSAVTRGRWWRPFECPKAAADGSLGTDNRPLRAGT